MKNKWFNILNLTIALSALGFSLLRIIPVEITNDTYLGVIATLIGISVTLIIGYQIYNSIEINRKLETIKEVEEKVRQQQALTEQTSHRAEGNLMFCQGQNILFQAPRIDKDTDRNKLYSKAFISFHTSVYEFLISDLRKIDSVFENLNSCVNDMTNTSIQDSEYKSLEHFSQQIRQLSNYGIISSKYEEILSDFLKKVGR